MNPGIFLSDMVKVSEATNNYITVPATESTPEMKLINFLKRQKMGEITHTILRHQPKVRDQYKINEVLHVCPPFPAVHALFRSTETDASQIGFAIRKTSTTSCCWQV